MINGKEYGWEDITAYMGGRDVMGFRSIKYTTKKEKEALYGKGNKALAIQSGNISNDGEIGLTQSEVEALEIASGGSLLDIQLDIVVSYGDPEKGDLPTIHKLRGVQFTEDPRETNQGDKFQDLSSSYGESRRRRTTIRLRPGKTTKKSKWRTNKPLSAKLQPTKSTLGKNSTARYSPSR